MRIRTGSGRTARLTAAFALLVFTAGAQITVAAAPAHAVDTSKGSPGYCPDAHGVTVIIDFRELGGTTIVRCARGEQATGHAALKNAGIEIGGVARWGESFICRIEGKPGPNSEPCIDTPPASAYWSYWHAPNGGSWTYSQWGVMNRKPPLGSFEGWSFSKDKTSTTNPPPRIAPRRPASTATPTPPKTNPPQPTPGTDGGNSGGGTTSGGSSAPDGNGTITSGGSSTSGGDSGDSGNSRGSSTSAGNSGGSSNSGGGSSTSRGGSSTSGSDSTTSGGNSGGGSTSGGNSGSTGTGSATSGNVTTGPTSVESATTTPSIDPLGPGPGVFGNPMETEPATQTPPPATDPVFVTTDAPTSSPEPSGITPQGQTWTGGEELARRDRDGIPTTTIVGAGLLVALCVAAGLTAWRRRARSTGADGA